MAERGGYPYEPDYTVPPGWVLEDYLEARKVSPTELAAHCGISVEQVQLILCGEAPVDSSLAEHLEKIFDLKASIWLRMEDSYRQGLKEGKKVPHFDKETVS